MQGRRRTVGEKRERNLRVRNPYHSILLLCLFLVA